MAVRTEEGKTHLDWSKDRALEYLNRNDVTGAWCSFVTDLAANEELSDHPGIELGNSLLFSGIMSTKEEIKKFIEDFN